MLDKGPHGAHVSGNHCCFWEHVKDHFRNCGNPLGTFKTWEHGGNIFKTSKSPKNHSCLKINFQTIPKNKLKLTLA